ncbi:hypothetical protein [Candidatus Coxiella mudrowiae]|uniref:hypothetical protein n=1 Tax=Candidatus Coxiella mudrowiae TaxID=2054173 RepID=UPI000C2821E1|nr:hypothetical protein [Candidatus Coxiella mudrowiae]
MLKTEFILSKRIDYLQQSIVFGTRHKHTFRKAAERHLKKKQSKTSLREDKRWIKVLDPYIGKLTLETIHHGSLQPFIDARQQEGVKNRTI